jgi:hypothetical protein
VRFRPFSNVRKQKKTLRYRGFPENVREIQQGKSERLTGMIARETGEMPVDVRSSAASSEGKRLAALNTR